MELGKLSEDIPDRTDVCIIGLGPAGLGAALTLLKADLELDIVCIDAGDLIKNRTCNILEGGQCDKKEPCSMISGIGGAFLLGGHKFSTLPAGSSLINILQSKSLAQEKMKQAFDILSNYISLHPPKVKKEDMDNIKKEFTKDGFKFRYYDSFLCSNIGLRTGFEEIIEDISQAGIPILPNTDLINLKIQKNHSTINLKRQTQNYHLKTKYLILGMGRWGEEVIRKIWEEEGLNGKTNNLEVGIRLEFPTEIIPDIDRLHNDLKLLYKNLRSFCVCKNGRIAPYYKDEIICLDGYSDSEVRSGYTNLAINLRLTPSPLNEEYYRIIKMNIQEISKGLPIIQILPHYMQNIAGLKENKVIPTTMPTAIKGNINDIYPDPISTELRNGVIKFVEVLFEKQDWDKIAVLAPSLEYTWPKFFINPDFSIKPHLYLIGDCTGQFRGGLQAFCSGIISAENIISEVRGRKDE